MLLFCSRKPLTFDDFSPVSFFFCLFQIKSFKRLIIKKKKPNPKVLKQNQPLFLSLTLSLSLSVKSISRDSPDPMASADQDLNKDDNHEESSPLLAKQEQQEDEKKTTKLVETKTSGKVETDEKAPAPAVGFVGGYAWTADGLPLRHGSSAVGEPMGRSQWNSGICACFGRNDEFCSSDLEVCKSLFLNFNKYPLYLPFLQNFHGHYGSIIYGWNCK